MAVKPMNMTTPLSGLSTDSKPLDGIYQGTMFIEIDTGDVYLYEGTSGTWIKQFCMQG